MKTLRSALALAALLAIPALAELADNGQSLELSPDATVVTADKLTFDYIRRFALFEGHVIVNDPRLQLSAGRLTIILDEDGGARTVKAEEHVLLSQDDKKARADIATYDIPSGRISLTGGPPQVMQGRNIMEGDVITFWRDQQRVECKPRARLVIYTEDYGTNSAAYLSPIPSSTSSPDSSP